LSVKKWFIFKHLEQLILNGIFALLLMPIYEKAVEKI